MSFRTFPKKWGYWLYYVPLVSNVLQAFKEYNFIKYILDAYSPLTINSNKTYTVVHYVACTYTYTCIYINKQQTLITYWFLPWKLRTWNGKPVARKEIDRANNKSNQFDSQYFSFITVEVLVHAVGYHCKLIGKHVLTHCIQV